MFILISFIGLLSYWCIGAWVPAMLRAERGMTIFQSSMWFIVMNIGGLVGYMSFGWVADRIGRRPAFTLFWVIAMVFDPLFVFYSKDPALLGVLGFMLGLALGFFSGYPLYGSELWPTALRGSGMGIAYMGIARMASTFGPTAIGAISDKAGIGTAMSIMSFALIFAVVIIWTMGYETKGKTLAELETK